MADVDKKIEPNEEGLVAFEFPDEKDGVAGDPKQVEVESKEPEEKELTTEQENDEPTEEELAQYSERVQKRIKQLTFKREEAKREKERVEQELAQERQARQQAIARAQELEQTVASGQTTVVSQAQKLAESEMEKAKSDLKKAYEAGDTDQFMTAQEAFTRAQMRLEAVKSYQARKPLQAAQQSANVATQQATAPTAQPTPSSKAQKWVAENQWFGKDEDLTSFARGLHMQLVTKGMDPESDIYYETLTERVRRAFPSHFEEKQSSGAKPNKPASIVAPSGRASSQKRVVLTATQVAFARRANIPLEEYAKQVMLMENRNG